LTKKGWAAFWALVTLAIDHFLRSNALHLLKKKGAEKVISALHRKYGFYLRVL
jgi:hypothetical protein